MKNPKNGWVEGSVQDFLGLSDADMEFIETRRALARQVHALRQERGLKQTALVARLKTSQWQPPGNLPAKPAGSVATKPSVPSVSVTVWMARKSREITVDFLAVEAANERHCAALENQADAVIAYANAVVFAGGFQTFEVGNLRKGLRGLHLLDDFFDSAKQ